MISSSSKQTGRLHSEVANLLFTPVEKACRVFSLGLVLLFLELLLLGTGKRLLLRLLCLEELEHWSEITSFEICDFRSVAL